MRSKYLISLITGSILFFSVSPALGQENNYSNITFFCESDRDIPLTIAKNQQRQTETIFYWKEEILKDIAEYKSIRKICSDVAVKLNKYADSAVEANDVFQLKLQADIFVNVPVLCITKQGIDCNYILFTINKNERDSIAIERAYNILNTIINSNIISEYKDHCKYRDCPAFHGIQLNLFAN